MRSCPATAHNILSGGIKMVLEKVKAILAEQFDVEEDKITEETDLQEDLGADSLDVVDLLMSIEDEFEVEVPDEEIENLKTVGALVAYIEANS
jgi:acyl carrier protein